MTTVLSVVTIRAWGLAAVHGANGNAMGCGAQLTGTVYNDARVFGRLIAARHRHLFEATALSQNATQY